MLALLMAMSLIIPMYNVQAANISSGFIGTDGFETVELGKTYTINGKKFVCIASTGNGCYNFLAAEGFGTANWIDVYNIEPNWYYSNGDLGVMGNSNTGKISSGMKFYVSHGKDLSYDGNSLIEGSTAANSTIKNWFTQDVKAITKNGNSTPRMPGIYTLRDNNYAKAALNAIGSNNILLGDTGTGYDITGSNQQTVTMWVTGWAYSSSAKDYNDNLELSGRTSYNQDNVQDPDVIEKYWANLKSYSGTLAPQIEIDMSKCQIKNGVISKTTTTGISATKAIDKVMSNDKVDLSKIVTDVKYNTGESAAYTVSFDSKYGSISGNTWTVASGLDSNTTVPITITSKSFGLTTTVNVELIAIFNITYDLAGGNVSGNPATYKTADSDITLKNPTKTGYDFTGWSGTGLTSPTTSVTIKSGSSGNRAYTANWKAKTYNVTFDKNGGKGGTDKISVTFNENVPSIDAPTRTSNTATYEFLGYFTSDGEKIFNADGSPAVSKWTTDENSLTATWKETPKQNTTPIDNSNNSDGGSNQDTSIEDVVNDDNSQYTPLSKNVVLTNSTLGAAVVKDDVLNQDVTVPLSYITEGNVYRMYDGSRGEHFYTKNEDEMKALTQLGWVHEENADFTVASALDNSAIAVYRLYNPNDGGMHFYTEDAEEVKALVNAGWNYEGISHYVYTTEANKGTEQYRLYNPNSSNGEHNWTTDKDQRNMLKEAGWVDEGACWKVV